MDRMQTRAPVDDKPPVKLEQAPATLAPASVPASADGVALDAPRALSSGPLLAATF